MQAVGLTEFPYRNPEDIRVLDPTFAANFAHYAQSTLIILMSELVAQGAHILGGENHGSSTLGIAKAGSDIDLKLFFPNQETQNFGFNLLSSNPGLSEKVWQSTIGSQASAVDSILYATQKRRLWRDPEPSLRFVVNASST